MALAVNAAAPTIAYSGTSGAVPSLTSGTFSPPAGLLLVAVILDGTSSLGQTIKVSDSTGTVYWYYPSERNEWGPAAWLVGGFLPNAATNMTITVAVNPGNNVNIDYAFKVYSITGVTQGQYPFGAIDNGRGAGNPYTTPAGLVTTRANSLVFFACEDFSTVTGEQETSGSTYVAMANATAVIGAAGYKAVAAAGTAVGWTFDPTGTGTTDFAWCALEILEPLAAAANPGYSPPTTIPTNDPVDPASTSQLVATKSGVQTGYGG